MIYPIAESVAEFAVQAPVTYTLIASILAALVGFAGQMVTGGKA